MFQRIAIPDLVKLPEDDKYGENLVTIGMDGLALTSQVSTARATSARIRALPAPSHRSAAGGRTRGSHCFGRDHCRLTLPVPSLQNEAAQSWNAQTRHLTPQLVDNLRQQALKCFSNFAQPSWLAERMGLPYVPRPVRRGTSEVIRLSITMILPYP